MDPNLNQNQPIPVDPPAPPKPNPASNTLIVLLVALSFILFASTGFLAYQNYQLKMQAKNSVGYGTYTPSPYPIVTSTPDPTVNWKTYNNSKYNFSIKYPTNWDYLEVPNETYLVGTDQVWFSPKEEVWPPPSTSAMPPIVISILKTDTSKNWSSLYFDNYQSEPYMVGNIDGQKISGINKESKYFESVILAKAGNYYLQISSNDSVASKAYIDQILSTFKFTN